MKTKRSFLIFSLLLVFTFVFAACSNNATAPNNNITVAPNGNPPDTSTPDSAESTPELRPDLTERQLKITLNDTDVIYAKLANSHATDIFIENLPFTIAMDDYINRNKRGTLPFVIEEEDLQNIIYPFETGDIIYYPPTRLLGVFYEHNGAEISAGYELVAQMDGEGIEAFKKYPGDVKVTVELDDASDASTQANAEPTPELRPSLAENQLKITLNDTDVIYAKIADSHATDIFLENLPFTIDMDDYINRNKRGRLPFAIDEEDLQNIIYPFETGDIIYYPPTQLLGIFYEHNGAEISAGYELVAQMDAEGIEAFKKYPGDVKVTVELNE